MRLQRLTLSNFRQFQDEVLEFAIGDKNNVTVVHGRNGSGKTTLLNAFTWLLYGKNNFNTGSEKLANEGEMARAKEGETVRVEVTLEFEDEGIDYKARRWLDVQKQDPTDNVGEELDSGLELKYRDESGTMNSRENPSVSLEQIIPERLSSLFFFDGEDIDELAGFDNQEQIQDAIQNIMGLTIIERSINHLESVEERFENEMQRHGSSELSDLIEKKRSLKSEIENLEQKKGDIKKNREQLLEDVKLIEQKLEWFEDSAALQKERSNKLDERKKLKHEVEGLEDNLRNEISKRGYLTFAMPAIEETAKDLDNLRAQGKIPSELDNKFVEKLLDESECICGRPLEEHSESYQKVSNYLDDENFDGVDQAAIRIISHLDHFSDERSEFFKTIEQIIDERKSTEDEITALSERIDQISSELEDIDVPEGQDVEDPGELEATRKQKEIERRELKDDIVRLNQRIDDKNEEKEKIKEKIEQAREEETKANTARKRMLAAEEVRKRFEGHFRDLQEQVRDWSNTMIKDTFSEIAQKHMQAEITDDFRLRILQEVYEGEMMEVNKSTGERQIASLAFIGSLVSIAKERYESDADTPYFTGGIYPIVMDSPFGALDNEHRRRVSRAMPKLGEQIIVLVTDSQWKGPVANEMKSIAGKQYQLEFSEGNGSDEYPRTEIVPEANFNGESN